MTTVDKVTVSLPAELSAYIEQRRADTGESRSGVLTDLCWRGWWQWDEARRIRQSEAAYTAVPETDQERAWAEVGAETMAGWDPWAGPEAGAEIERERGETLEQVQRLVAEPGASAFVKAVREALKDQRAGGAAG
ncbi:MAG TPA: hypothetical protein VLL25_10665 [Acidimicrobiales bacterium]|nr:hypothetical protein [Acidimicrobiales bacterium]